MAIINSVGVAECALCLCLYEDPRVLPLCGHSFCLKCIKRSAKSNSLEVECPLCRKPSSITSGGFEGLPINYALISLLPNLSLESAKDLGADVDNVLCLYHKDEELVIVCIDCWMSLCVKCHEEAHSKHRMSSVRKFVADAITKFQNDGKDINIKLSQVKSLKDKLKGNKAEFLNQITEQEVAINEEFASLKLLLEQERSKLVEELMMIKQSVLKNIEQHNQEFEFQCQELRSLNTRIREMTQVTGAKVSMAAVTQLKEINERLNNAVNTKIELEGSESVVKFLPTDFNGIIKKSSISENLNIIGKLQLNPISKKERDQYEKSELVKTKVSAATVGKEALHNVPERRDESDRPLKRNPLLVQHLKPLINPSSDASQEVNRSLPQTPTVRDHIWHYILFKHADKVADICARNSCEAKLVSGFSKQAPSYFLQVSPFLDEKSNVNYAKNSVENAIEEFVQLFQKLSNLVIMEENVKLPPEMDKTKSDDLRKTLDQMGFLLMPSDLHRLIGPESRLQEAKDRVWKVISEHQRKIRSTGTIKKDTEKDKPMKLQPAADDPKVPFSFHTSNGLAVLVSQGNLVNQQVDAIVSPANCYLDHASGAAGAISKAAGQRLNYESRDYIDSRGPLRTTCVMHTSAGNLQPRIRYVIHAVGPRKSGFTTDEILFEEVKRTVYNCLDYANSILKIQSIAIPAISSGIFGIPLKTVAEASFSALEEFDNTSSSGRRVLRDVHFLNIDDATVSCMKKTMSLIAMLLYLGVNACRQFLTRTVFPGQLQQRCREILAIKLILGMFWSR